jgi:nucleoside-diphosphate-sugar epimerase
LIDKLDLQHILDHVDLSSLKGKRVFITGGTGFIGKWIVESLIYANKKLKLDIQITILVRDIIKALNQSPSLSDINVEWLKDDVRELDIRELKASEYDYVFHLASDDGHRLTTKNPIEMLDIISNGTRNVLENFKNSKAKVFFLSSGKVVSEEVNAYTQGKRFAEYWCQLYHEQYGMDIKLARGYCFYGAYLPLTSHFAIGNFIKDVLENKPVNVKGDGYPLRSYLYMSDAVIWIFKILLSGKSLYPYELGSVYPMTMGNLAKVVSEYGTGEVITKSDFQDIWDCYLPKYGDNESELGLNQYISLDEGLKKTLEWYKNVERI